MKVLFDYFEDKSPSDGTVESICDEMKRVAGMIREGYTSGELTAGEGRGWWSIEREQV